jgi:hypothetical protein
MADRRERPVGRSKHFPGQENLSRPKRPRRQRDHCQERAERDKLGEITQRLNSDSLHHGLLDHDKAMICSFFVLVNRALRSAFAIGGIARFAAGFGRASASRPSNCPPRHCQSLARVLKAKKTGDEAGPMTVWRKRALILVFVAFAPGSAPLALAQSTNALPDLTTSEAPFDPGKVAGLPDVAKAAVGQAIAKMKSGEILGFVLAASPDLKIWTLNSAPRTMADYVPSDAGRQALEVCEFEARQPCAILSVNGFQARQRAAGSAPPPEMLFSRASDFDATVLPFVAASTREQAAAYQKAQGPRAFALTTNGLWLWRGGANIIEAIDKTMADCVAEFKPAPCLLYAVNDRVVFEARWGD